MSTSVVHARIDSNLKEDAEEILSRLGITPTIAIEILYRQIILYKGVPIDLNDLAEKPLSIGKMTPLELDFEINKGLASLGEGKGIPAEELYDALNKEFGI